MEEEPKCRNCGSNNLKKDYEKGEVVCMECGVVLDESVLDEGPEWRAFTAEEREEKQRTGGPKKYSRIDKNLSTEIDQFNRDARSKKLKTEVSNRFRKLRKWHRKLTYNDSKARNLGVALRQLNRMASALSLPSNIVEETALLYRKILNKGLVKGRVIEEVLVATLYIICRKREIPRTLQELSEVAGSGASEKAIGRTYRMLKRELDIEVPLPDPVEFVSRYGGELNLSGEVQEEAKRILESAKEKRIVSGKGPTGVAAAALYLAAKMKGEKRTQKEVSEAANVTEVTIRNRYRELKENLDLENG